jgi:uncharacterized repeat protein (TIGR03803 family)
MRMLRNSARALGAFIVPLTIWGQTYSTLYSFGSQDRDGINPPAGVILGSQGAVYGTTNTGGESGFGTVYELLPPVSPGGAWTEVVLHSFNGPDGEYPDGGLAMGPNGALYGVTANGTGGYATVFELDPPTGGGAVWPVTVLYRIPAVSYSFPSGALVLGKDRSLYGAIDEDTVYSLTPPSATGGGWTETILSNSGIWPVGTLAVSANGTLFGASISGGSGLCNAGCGMVFSLTPPAAPGGPWTKEMLYAFEPRAGDGYVPHAGLVLAPNGVLYGTTAHGGAVNTSGGHGIVFSLTPPAVPGAPMTETILRRFKETDGDGYGPNAGLVLGPNGAIYGTTRNGGASGLGTVFELAPPASPGGNWTETILHSFAGGSDGYQPNEVVLGSNGTLYGTTWYGGTSGYGTVFSLTP